MLNCLITHKEPERIKSQNFGFTKSLVVNLYKRALLTHQSPTTKIGKQVNTVLVPTLTTTKKIHKKNTAYKPNGFKIVRPQPCQFSREVSRGGRSLSLFSFATSWSTTRAHRAFQIPTGLSAQWEETVMEHSVLKFFLLFHIPTPCWVQFRWQAGQVKKLIFALYAL